MAHTPGPWVYLQDDPFWGEIRSAETFDLIAQQPEADDREADFILMAAAPDLLAACETLLEEVVTEDNARRAPSWQVIEQARAAVARARGEG